MTATAYPMAKAADPKGRTRASRRSRARVWDRVATGVFWASAGAVVLVFAFIVIQAVALGLPALRLPGFLTNGSYYVGIAPQIFNTFYLLLLSMIIMIPIGLGAAIYMVEYARQGFTLRVLRYATETTTALPSILVGFLGFLIFVTHFSHGQFLGLSPAAGALTLAVLNLPWMLRTLEDALRAVPLEYRDGSLALGASRWQTMQRVILPAAIPGIVTGILIVAGRVIGESAVLLFTTAPPAASATGNGWFTLNPFTVGGETLAVHAYNLFAEPGAADTTTLRLGTAFVLIVLTLLFNIGARIVGYIINKRFTGR